MNETKHDNDKYFETEELRENRRVEECIVWMQDLQNSLSNKETTANPANATDEISIIHKCKMISIKLF